MLFPADTRSTRNIHFISSEEDSHCGSYINCSITLSFYLSLRDVHYDRGPSTDTRDFKFLLLLVAFVLVWIMMEGYVQLRIRNSESMRYSLPKQYLEVKPVVVTDCEYVLPKGNKSTERAWAEDASLKEIPVRDHLLVANASLSKFSLLNPKVYYRLGEEIQIVVEMYDGYGRRRNVGGDMIQWRPQNLVPFGRDDFPVKIPARAALFELADQEAEELYYSYIQTIQVLCQRIVRVGSIFDGGKELCVDEPYKPKIPCLVYSFGINWKWDFDEDMVTLFGCEVFAFDPSMMNETDFFKRGPSITFHKIGLWNRHTVDDKGWHLMTLKQIRQKLGHENIMPWKQAARKIYVRYIVSFLLGYIISTFQPWRLTIYMNSTERVHENEVTVICVESKTDPKFSICPYQKEDDMHVSRWIREKGVWDHVLTKLLQIAFSLYQESIFIDTGANIGYFSFYAGALGHDVLAIEPFSASFRKIKQGLALNAFSGHIKLLNNALSNKRSIVHMGEPMKLNKGHIIVDNEDVIDSKRETVGDDTIEAMTMDDMLKYVNGNEAILKMDIEGYECKAFGKSSALFQNIFVPYIFMEWLQIQDNMNEIGTACSEEAARNLVNYLGKLGYTPVSYNPILKHLDPHAMMNWTVYDILWQHQNATSLLPFIDFIRRE